MISSLRYAKQNRQGTKLLYSYQRLLYYHSMYCTESEETFTWERCLPSHLPQPGHAVCQGVEAGPAEEAVALVQEGPVERVWLLLTVAVVKTEYPGSPHPHVSWWWSCQPRNHSPHHSPRLYILPSLSSLSHRKLSTKWKKLS